LIVEDQGRKSYFRSLRVTRVYLFTFFQNLRPTEYRRFGSLEFLGDDPWLLPGSLQSEKPLVIFRGPSADGIIAAA